MTARRLAAAGVLVATVAAGGARLALGVPPGAPRAAPGDSSYVDAAGHRVYVVVEGPAGRAARGPAVVFVGALGEDHETWRAVQDSLARDVRTVSYDRHGLGRSDAAGPLAKDAAAMAEELRDVVARTVSGPFVLVSHSLGCDVARVFEARHPAGVVGAVYIDPPPDPDALRARVGPALWSARDSAIRAHTPPMNAAQAAEFRLQPVSYRQAAAAGPLRRLPRLLYTATLTYADFPASREELAVKRASHAAWLRAMPGARQVVVPESRHYVHADRPGLVVAGIRDVLARSAMR